MHQADLLGNRVDKIDRTAICDVDAEANVSLIRDEPVATGETFVILERSIDDSNLAAVNLLRSDKRRCGESACQSDFAMKTIESGERLLLIVRDVDPGSTQREPVDDVMQSCDRAELFDGKTVALHLA